MKDQEENGMKNKMISVLTAAVMAAAMFAGCGSSTATGSSDSVTSSSGTESEGEEVIAVSAPVVTKAGGNIVGKMAVLAEGDAMERPDIIALHKLPLFDADGNIKE